MPKGWAPEGSVPGPERSAGDHPWDREGASPGTQGAPEVPPALSLERLCLFNCGAARQRPPGEPGRGEVTSGAAPSGQRGEQALAAAPVQVSRARSSERPLSGPRPSPLSPPAPCPAPSPTPAPLPAPALWPGRPWQSAGAEGSPAKGLGKAWAWAVGAPGPAGESERHPRAEVRGLGRKGAQGLLTAS